MAYEIAKWKLSDIKRDLLLSHRECSTRGLLHSSKWAAELMFTLKTVQLTETESSVSVQVPHCELDNYSLAKSYFDMKEYDRASYFLESCCSPPAIFLYYYSRYLAGEKRRLDGTSDTLGGVAKVENDHLKILRNELQKKMKETDLDGYCLYLYGVILKKLSIIDEAVISFVKAITKVPHHWGAWLELSSLVNDKDSLWSLSLPDHWMKNLFLAHIYLELQMNDEALTVLQQLSQHGFAKSGHVIAQCAQAFHNLRDVDQAVERFTELQKVDPYRLENMDTYSNLLYVKEMRAELAHLAHHCCDIDKYRVETCCVIGNYYSLRGQHEKAIEYFQRALKLSPEYLAAWTLMGHEYMEMRNTAGAIQAYRQAIEVNQRDYRAWYGLGQTYEILKMPFYSLYYYRQAMKLRPNDSRMIVALGDAYEKLNKLQEAKKCFWRAHSIGDVEGIALNKLAKLYERLNEGEQAAAAYTDYINQANRLESCSYEEQAHAYKYLANYHIGRGNLDEAYTAAHKCTEYNETREEGKALLRQIAGLRSLGEGECSDSIGTERFHRQLPTHTPLGRVSPMNLTFTP